MKLFFAGTENDTFTRWIRNAGGTRILQSAFYLNYKRAPDFNFEHVLDSGGFTARVKNKPIDVGTYRDYINNHNVKVAFNLDVNDPKVTLYNQEFLEKETDCYIIPVYHYSEFVDPEYRNLLFDYIDRYQYIGIGGTAEGIKSVTDNKMRLFDFVFRNTKDQVKVHGLAITATKLLRRYPFFSVDSVSWKTCVMYGSRVKVVNGDIVTYGKKLGSTLKDPNQFESNEDLIVYASIKAYLEVEDFCTRLWERRGITWDGWPYG